MASTFNPFLDPATQIQIDRQRKMADMLMQQSMTPEQGQMVSGHYVAPSITQNLAHLLQGYVSKKMNDKSDEQQVDQWNSQINGSLGDFGISPTQTVAPNTATQSTPDASIQPTDASVPQDPNAQPTTQPSSQGLKLSAALNGTALPTNNVSATNTASPLVLDGYTPEQSMALSYRNPAAYETLLKQQLSNNATPDAVKTSRLYGVPDSVMGGGLAQENTYKGLPAKAQEALSMGLKIGTPEFNSYVSTVVTPNGNAIRKNPDGSVSVPAGALDAVTSFASAGEKAKLSASDLFATPTPIDTPTGKVALTPAQQRSMANGGIDPAQTPMQRAVQMTESGNNPNAVSSAGAQGLMQVMPNTQTNPGFGVAPAKNNSPAELQRVGNDYINAMQNKYKDPTLATIAYNMGAGKTDAWLQAGGDYNKLPNETKSYISQVMTRNAVNSQQPNQTQAQQGIPLKSNFANKSDELNATNMAAYDKSLNERVQTGSDLNMRLQEQMEAMKNFQAGGGAETRAHMAQMAQAIGLPDATVNKIAGGDLASMQVFKKNAAQTAMEQLKQAMSGAGRMTQAEYKIFLENNPNLSLDPKAIDKIFNFQHKTFNRDLQEQQSFQDYKQQNPNDTSGFPAYWAGQLQTRGYTNPNLNSNAGGASPAHPQDNQAIQWAKSNPNDPRSKAILKANGVN